MRDYKNVKVPRKYRTRTTRVSLKRVETRRGRKKDAAGVKRLFLSILGFALLAGCCWAGWKAYHIITHAETFQISGVDVTGVQHLGEADLKSIAGDFKGKNIFKVDLQTAVRQARLNPWIKEVTIRRSLPNRITMAVVERVPFAFLDTAAGRYLIDAEAVVIDRVSKEDAASWSLPVVAMKDFRPQPGEPVASESIEKALSILADISARGGWELADVTIKAASPETVSIVYADLEFKMGAGNYAEKLKRLAEVMADVKQRGLNIAYVDLRPERQAAVMVKDNKARGPAGKDNRKIPNKKITNKRQ